MDTKHTSVANSGSKSSYSKLQLPNGAKSTFAPVSPTGDNRGDHLGKQTTPQGSTKRLRPGPPPPPPPTKPPSLSLSREPASVTSLKIVGGESQSRIKPASGDPSVSLVQAGRKAGNGCDDVARTSSNHHNKTTTAAAAITTSGETDSPTVNENNAFQKANKKCSHEIGKELLFDKNIGDERTAKNNNRTPLDLEKKFTETHASCEAAAGGYTRKSTSQSTRNDSVCSSSSPRLKYKKARPAPPPPKPPDSKTSGSVRVDSNTGGSAVSKMGRLGEVLSQSEDDSETARSDISSNNSSVSGSPRLAHRNKLLGKKSFIVKPSTPPPAPPGESVKHKTVNGAGIMGRGSVSDNQGLNAADEMHTPGCNEEKTVDIINQVELGTVGQDQEVSKPQDLQKLGDCDNQGELNTGDVISSGQEEMQGDKELKTVIISPQSAADNTKAPDNTTDSTQPSSAAVVATATAGSNTCGSSKSHMRSPIHMQKPKRRKNHFALALCCGLGGLARPESPLELELPMRTEGTLPRGNDVIVRGQEVNDTVKMMAADSSQSLTNVPNVILPGAECESKARTLPKGRQNIFDSLTSPEEKTKHVKISQTQSCHSLSIVKPVIHDVKLLKSSSRSPMPTRTQHPVHCIETDDDVFLPESSHTPVANNKSQISSPVENVAMVTNPHSLEVEEVRLRTPSKSRTESDLSVKVAQKPRSHSVEDMSCVVVDLDLGLVNEFERNKNYRSSFMSEDIRNSKPALFQTTGEFQTVLKHSKMDTEKLYALPQPACYGDSTLKAVKLITDKYDTLERWKLRAMSFREDTLKNAARLKFKEYGQTSDPVGTIQCEQESDKGSNSAESHENKKSEIALPGTPPDITQSVDQAAIEPKTLDEVDNRSASASLTQSEVAATNHSALKLAKVDLQRIKVFFSSTETQVVVCGCTADMMLGPMDNTGLPKEWEHQSTGVPVLVLTTGEGRAKRELNLILAERDTGFCLWQDKINYLSQYKEQTAGLHTMHLSSSLMKIVGFKFHEHDAADAFLKGFQEITKDSNDELWKVSRGHKKRKSAKKAKHKVKGHTPVKGDISQPLQFEHVTNIDSRNPSILQNLNSFMPKESDGPNSEPEEAYRLRTYSG